jgi:hypothetical protein
MTIFVHSHFAFQASGVEVIFRTKSKMQIKEEK